MMNRPPLPTATPLTTKHLRDATFFCGKTPSPICQTPHYIPCLLGLGLLAGALFVTGVAAEDVLVQEAYLKASNSESGDFFGAAVAVDGDTLVVGANGEDSAAAGVNGNQADNSASSAGAAYVYVRDGAGAWVQQAYLKPSDPAESGSFGEALALDGDTLVVAGKAAYVFVRDAAGTWAQQARLLGSNTEVGDSFATSVALDRDTIVVGAPREASSATGIGGNQADNSADAAGAAYIFVRDTAGTWSQQAYVKASNTDAGDLFGWSVAVDGNTAVVGASREDSGATGVDGDQDDESAPRAGAAYVFVRDGGGNWTQQAYLKASNTEAGDFFAGFIGSLALCRDTLVVGATGEDSSSNTIDGNQSDNAATDAGAAYVFVRNPVGRWSQHAYLKASNAGSQDLFGASVALSGNRLAIGAIGEASGATGIDGNQNDGSSAGAGAVYMFSRDGAGSWAQQAYLKASNTGAGDFFGVSVGLQGRMLIVGAPAEDSSATGSNGDQTDDSAPSAGAAYFFRLPSEHRAELLGFRRAGDELEIHFEGVLQRSGDLLNWTDVVPQPVSPYRFSTGETRRFFRARPD
ncbi:hypothetical protein BH23VER1_BH23VER1_13130 [soil metagenome]